LKPADAPTHSGLFVCQQLSYEGEMTETINFEKMRGLAPAIVQDAASGEVLMLGFMTGDAFQHTLASGYVTFYSRSRNELWTKGKTSGNRLKIISASTDCDRDTLLFRVQVEGAGKVCHEGTRSCFTKEIVVRQTEPTTAAPEAAL
jgi:phosphoribosyl-ATP pyrophosphohydrolase/phosphoribosyl-AMP cyclohydrolase